jgi:hypothetical protein
VTDKQRTVIWLGMILIVLNLATKWGQVREVIFGAPASTATTAANPPSNTTATPAKVQAV